jgi:hypothetical protein
MAKKHEKKTEPEMTEEEAELARNLWGIGFVRVGPKFMAYRMDSEGITQISPPRGEQLHSALAKIQIALGKEVAKANRGGR